MFYGSEFVHVVDYVMSCDMLGGGVSWDSSNLICDFWLLSFVWLDRTSPAFKLQHGRPRKSRNRVHFVF